MATTKISDLTAVTLVSSSAVFPIVQDGTTVKVTFANLTGSLRTVPTASYALFAVSASHEITYELSSSYAETASLATTASYAATGGSGLDIIANEGIQTFYTYGNKSITIEGATAISGTPGVATITIVSSSYAATASRATTASYALSTDGFRVDGGHDFSTATNVKVLGFVGATAFQVDSTTALMTIVSSSYAATSSWAQKGIYNPSATTITIGSGVSYPNTISVTEDIATLYSARVTSGINITGSLVVKHHTNPANFSVGVDNADNVQIGASGWLPILLDPNNVRTSLNNNVHISGSVAVKAGEVLTLAPVHPLPNSIATGSFAVSGSTPPKPYFWDGSSWNALY
jgi:hypothetical protein